VGLKDVLPTCVSAADGEARGSLPAGRDVWLGQLAEKEKGLYAAMDAEWKYVYSAPDQREYLIHRGAGEGPARDQSECAEHAEDLGTRGVRDRLRYALQERFRADGYLDPLDDTQPDGWRHFETPVLAWEALDEMEDRSTVARGWQYARWNKGDALWDRRVDSGKAAFRFARD
jgi:hypothetical protein